MTDTEHYRSYEKKIRKLEIILKKIAIIWCKFSWKFTLLTRHVWFIGSKINWNLF